ncbi:hypothetical protein TrCOL_g10101 [Triparma columacea]|uniref:Dynein light chain n=1 Tax=Triparma columacea TaxID=722753 RepID=A0A9W7L8N1_9STRA|nr:hypothetical protein TrCOL_g10101 [Triparma columacea]
MSMMDPSEEFPEEDIQTIVKPAIAQLLNGVQFNPSKVNDWCNTIIDTCLKELQSLSKPYKYVITCVMMQKNGGGMTTSAACYWDGAKDGKTRVPFENDTMHCIVTVYGLSVNIDTKDDEV